MAKSVRIKLNKNGVGELLKSQGVQADLRKRMARVKARAENDPNLPEGVEVSARNYVGHDRARSSLGIPGSLEARYGILSRALDAAGGE